MLTRANAPHFTDDQIAEWNATYRDHVHDWFGLTYSSYLVLPRVVLSSLPPATQLRFLALIAEIEAEFPDVEMGGPYKVEKTLDDGETVVPDPLSDYRHRRITPKSEVDEAVAKGLRIVVED